MLEGPNKPCIRGLRLKNIFDLPGRFALWRGQERHGSIAVQRLSDEHRLWRDDAGSESGWGSQGPETVYLKTGKAVLFLLSAIALSSPGMWVALMVKLLMRVRRVMLRARSIMRGDLKCFELIMATTD